MDKDKRQDRIDDYLLGQGSPESRREFEEETSRNEDLSRELGDTELAMAAIEMAEDQALKARLQALEQQLSTETRGTAVAPPLTAVAAKRLPETKVVEMRSRRKGPFKLLAYAAALLLMLAVGWWALAQPEGFDAQQLAMDSFTPYKNIATGTVRGEGDDTAEAIAFAAYDAGNYAEAANKFSTLSGSNVHQFYLAQSLLAQEKFADAADIFTKLSTVKDFALAPESSYFAALSRLGLGQKAAAQQALEAIVATPKHLMLAEAKALLAKM